MNPRPIEKRFIFHANAVALAAHIRRSSEFFVPSVASSCLPVTGGISKVTEAGRDYRGIFSYSSASSNVFGDYADRAMAASFTHGNHQDNNLPTVTVAESSIDNLTVAIGKRKVVIGNLSAHMQAYSDRKSFPSFHELKTTFKGITVDGVELRVDDHCGMFAEHDTKAKLCARYERDAGFRKQFGDCFFPTGIKESSWWPFQRPKIPEANGTIVATVVSKLSWIGAKPPENTVIDGNKLTIGGLGSLYFGEAVIQEGFRRLTLIRFQLGCPDGGEGAACEIQSNGTGWPPRVDGGDSN